MSAAQLPLAAAPARLLPRPRRAALNLPERRAVLASCDLLAGAAGCLLAVILDGRVIDRALPASPLVVALFAVAWLASMYLLDGYSAQLGASAFPVVALVAKATPIVAGCGFLLFFVSPYQVNRPVLVLSVLLGALLILGVRLPAQRALFHEGLATRAILVSTRAAIPELSAMLGTARQQCRIVGTLRCPRGSSARYFDALADLLDRTVADEVIVDSRDLAELRPLIEGCIDQGWAVVSSGAIIERYESRVALGHLDSHWLLTLTDQDRFVRPYLALRRLAEIAASLLLALLLLALLPVLAALIKLDSRGPVFYRQRRLGQYGRDFDILKLRTMRTDAEREGARWARPGDGRATAVGRVLRATRLDELPQAINVLRGQMSFIGPRPERPEFARLLEREIPHYRTRLLVRPGITGWAQVKSGYAGTVSESRRKVEYDLFYVKNRSLRLDLQIAVLTAFVVLGLRGR